LWKDRERKDYVSMTAHDRLLEQDYAGVDRLGFKGWRPLRLLAHGTRPRRARAPSPDTDLGPFSLWLAR
jgi:hypothetical protein